MACGEPGAGTMGPGAAALRGCIRSEKQSGFLAGEEGDGPRRPDHAIVIGGVGYADPLRQLAGQIVEDGGIDRLVEVERQGVLVVVGAHAFERNAAEAQFQRRTIDHDLKARALGLGEAGGTEGLRW